MSTPNVAKAETRKTVARRHVVGLDLGQAQDPSALAVLEESQSWMPDEEKWVAYYAVRYLYRWPLGEKYPAIVEDVTDLLANQRIIEPLLVIDATGVGAAVCDLFDDANPRGERRRVLITAGHATTSVDGTWHVAKKQLVSVLQVLLQNKRLAIAKVPDREILVKELLAFRVKISAALNELYGSCGERDHDDLVLAVALASWGAESVPAYDGALPLVLGSPTRPWEPPPAEFYGWGQ